MVPRLSNVKGHLKLAGNGPNSGVHVPFPNMPIGSQDWPTSARDRPMFGPNAPNKNTKCRPITKCWCVLEYSDTRRVPSIDMWHVRGGGVEARGTTGLEPRAGKKPTSLRAQ